MKKTLFTLSLGFCSLNLFAQNTYYINPDATGNNDGSSWQDGFTSFDEFVFSGIEPDYTNPAADTIMVKMGTYYLDNLHLVSTNNKGLRIYGGFQGMESFATQGNPALYPTIFNGDISNNDDPNNTSTWVDNRENLLEITCAEVGEIHVEGITFRGAINPSANGSNGSAIWINTTYDATGTIPMQSNFSIVNCIFTRNFANGLGGAVYIKPTTNYVNGSYCNVVFDKCQFIENGSGSRGSAIMCFADNDYENATMDVNVTNSLFVGNTDLIASEKAVIYAASSGNNSITNLRVINNTFITNLGMGAFGWTSRLVGNTMKVTFANNMTVPNFSYDHVVSVGVEDDNNPDGYEYNVFNNVASGGIFTALVDENLGNVTANIDNINLLTEMPNGATGNYALGASAVAVDYGSIDNINMYYIDDKDLLGNPRLSGQQIDAGAYEFQQSSVSINEYTQELLMCYPNPAKDEINLVLNKVEMVSITNVQGSVLFQGELSGLNKINVNQWNSGVYFIQTASGLCAKFVKN